MYLFSPFCFLLPEQAPLSIIFIKFTPFNIRPEQVNKMDPSVWEPIVNGWFYHTVAPKIYLELRESQFCILPTPIVVMSVQTPFHTLPHHLSSLCFMITDLSATFHGQISFGTPPLHPPPDSFPSASHFGLRNSHFLTTTPLPCSAFSLNTSSLTETRGIHFPDNLFSYETS